jgi:hypothetical protein
VKKFSSTSNAVAGIQVSDPNFSPSNSVENRIKATLIFADCMVTYKKIMAMYTSPITVGNGLLQSLYPKSE